jgi:hypothetical protein
MIISYKLFEQVKVEFNKPEGKLDRYINYVIKGDFVSPITDLPGLFKDKEYEVLSYSKGEIPSKILQLPRLQILIKDSFGVKRWWPSDYFKLLGENRIKEIDQIFDKMKDFDPYSEENWDND